MESASQQAIQAVAESGNHEDYECPKIVPVNQVNHNERNEDHPQQRELVGGSQNLGKLHARSLEACDGDPELLPWGVSAAEGSRFVLAKKRCESEGRLPSGKSSSTRSMRCIGKKTTAGVNGSPSLPMTVRSSNDASSAPLKLSPSVASARIMPQNFSLGFDKVAMTIAPGTKTSPDRA